MATTALTDPAPDTYHTSDGDMLDALCRARYGTAAAGIFEAVLEANPHLLAYPPKLPAGLPVTFPDLPPADTRTERLW